MKKLITIIALILSMVACSNTEKEDNQKEQEMQAFIVLVLVQQNQEPDLSDLDIPDFEIPNIEVPGF